MPEASPTLLFDFLKTHHELAMALGSRLTHRLEQEHNIQLKDLMVAREIHMGTRYPSDIARKLRIPRDMVSRALDRLVQAGTISREIDPDDSRRTILSINPEGENRRQQVQQTIFQTLVPLTASLNPEELSTLTTLMQKMLTGIHQDTPPKEHA